MREISMDRMRLLTLPLTAALLLALAACSKSPDAGAAKPGAETANSEQAGGEGHAEGGEEEAASSVKMDDAAMKAAGIRLQTLRPSALSEELRAPGEVVDTGYGTTLITPQVEALVVRRHAKLGDEVRAGAPLATLTSVDVSDAQAELRIAEQEWRRVSALGREAVAGRRITEAKVAVDRARAKAQAYGLPGTASGGVNGQFTLTAPHAGRITEDDFVVGERIEPGKALFRLIDESVVWVDAKLQAGTAHRIRPSQEAVVLFDGERLAGTVQQAAHRTSDATRNAVVRIKVPNQGDRLHSGDFVDVFFEATGSAQADSRAATEVAVPNDALVQLAGDTVVFRRNAEGALEPVPVRTGEVIGDRTLIRDGLKPGDTVVVAGAFALKSQMLKSQLGEEE
ncbi:efflux transporter periplasmic adaptor subunit [Stenotrophomonas pavanii]|uniref:Efflux transporter periplasmic adaptor subunit n=1 Tax=Stenotrophomonas pavanii TaxID=487698 RepID=A0A246KYF7_9GAMM|nr:efflux RND transporter periplasmic adaptor subunit [Stenotrophomonas pavanii]OWR33593.1 efflux transporter periplasmic adaptor subunit [Stenotrophomonas pavanii]